MVHMEDGTPALRLFALLEHIARTDRLVTLTELVAETGLPKPTVHRMLQQLEGAGLLDRQGDGRRYGAGGRLRAFAEDLLTHGTHHAARHAVLRHLVDEIGETCNLTAPAGPEVVYLDRVETPEPLRFALRPGSRVPVHCSASGKLILAFLPAAQRRKILTAAPLKAFTARTRTDPDALETELEQVRRDGFALDDEEFLPGLVCAAVPVPRRPGDDPSASRVRQCVALQAPAVRVDVERAVQLVPVLRRAAERIARIEAE